MEKVWEIVGRAALEQVLGTAEARARNGAAGALEEDARLVALFLWTLQSTNGEWAEAEPAVAEEDGSVEDEDEGKAATQKPRGYRLVYDVVRRFAQPLGIDLARWEGGVIETKKGVVRLLPVAERAKQLFGKAGAQAVPARLEPEAVAGPAALQGVLFPDVEADPAGRGRKARRRGRRTGAEATGASLATAGDLAAEATARPGATTLDRVHMGMLLQASGQTNALRALIAAEQARGPDFLRLANALSALYPRGSEEKRLLDAMLLALPR